MVRRFQRKFDPNEPRNSRAELYDTHRPPRCDRPPLAVMPAPSKPPVNVWVLPCEASNPLCHSRRDCEVLAVDTRLARLCGQSTDVEKLNLSEIHIKVDWRGCPLCRSEYRAVGKRCVVETATGPREADHLLWRRHEEDGWLGLVMYERDSRRVVRIHPAADLRLLKE